MNRSAPCISVVVPVYGSPQSIDELCCRIRSSLDPVVDRYEVLLVNDASPDESWTLIEAQSELDSRFVGINLARNFGQHAAISAGLVASRGEWVVVMDCDLQDRPEEIPRLYARALEGFEQVVAVRAERQDSWLKRHTSASYARVLSYLTDQTVNPAVGNFGIYHRQVIDVINSMPEQGRTFGLLALWTGFRRSELDVQHDARPYGRSSYSFRKLIRQALMGVISHSDKPLRMTMKLGAAIAGVSLLAAAFICVRAFQGDTANGWASVMVMLAFMMGINLGSIGVVGLYVGRVLDESKRRPTYVIWTTTGDQFAGGAGDAASTRSD
ncbi:MAG: putative glycosyltransferase [Ilumatobacteraceae bacterium]|nr:putative glycosyltransferase [Ilumatobacteraceae bacterium]